MGIKCNVHVTISGAVSSTEQLQPIVTAISDALDRAAGDAWVNYNVFASTDKQIEAKRAKAAREDAY